MLASWIAEKRAEIATLGDLPLTELTPSRRDFTQFVATGKRGIALVPRLQRSNPERGGEWPSLDEVEFARVCDDADVAAIAVRTAALFGGSADDLDAVAGAVSAPVLRDDLCLGELQVYQSRLRGADAVVVPAAELDTASLRELAATANSLHMTAVVAVETTEQLAVALALPGACIGLIGTGSAGRVDIRRARALGGAAPRQRTVLLLDEVEALDELLELAGVIDAAVVGDALLDAADPAAMIAAFLAQAG